MKKITNKNYLLCLVLTLTFGSILAQDALTKGEKLNHVLMFKWAKDMDQEEKAEVMYLFKGLPDKVEGFESIDVRPIGNSSDAFDVILVLQFDSKNALKTYEEHPDHLRIAEIGPTLLEKFAFVDYWK